MTPADPMLLAPLPEDPRAVVLMLHGGAERGTRPVDGRSLALRRPRHHERDRHGDRRCEGDQEEPDL